MNESKLIQQCQQGKRAAQRMLFDQYYSYVYTISHRYLRHHQDAEDVTSVVFRRVFENILKVHKAADDGLKKWIQTISINESLRFLKQKKSLEFIADYNLVNVKVESTDSNVESDVKSVKKAINDMPNGYRTIFLLNVVEGLSHSEIAEHLGISRNTSKSQMLKARRYLQNKLGKNESRQLRG